MTDGDDAQLFVYGSLLPGTLSWSILQPFVLGHGQSDSVLGELFDTGLGYPAARFADGASSCVAGRVFELIRERRGEALAVLDEFEDVASGLYHRVLVTTTGGAFAWAYEAGCEFELVQIQSGDWLNRS